MSRIFLSTPDVGPRERSLLLEAFDAGWLGPLGPHVEAFERELAAVTGVRQAAALSSGTAALHLALLLSDVPRDAEVLTATLTFAATANAITYVGARPTFVDCDPHTWQVDPGLLAEVLQDRARTGSLPAAVVTVDLYGQCCDYDPITALCSEYGIPLIEDAAEALGADYRGRYAGSLGRIGVLSFNGNKIITTGGGGALVSDDASLVQRARFLATQARDPAPHYEHSHIGYNYRLSGLLAAVGRAQLETLWHKVRARKAINARYRAGLASLPGLEFMPEAPYGSTTWWLTCLTIDEEAFGASAHDIRLALEASDIEARPVWKPMHLQPVFASCDNIGGGVAARIFARGLCLPSGSAMTEGDQDRVIEVLHACHRS